MARILIPDYPGQQVVSAIRTLVRERGDSVTLASSLSSREKFFSSRYIDGNIPVAHPGREPEQYLDDLVRILDREPYDMLMPFGYNAYAALAPRSDLFENRIRTLLPSLESYRVAVDKQSSARLCHTLDIKIPQTFSAVRSHNTEEIIETAGFPLVVKVRSGTGVETGLRYARNREELNGAFRELSPGDRIPLMVQELIPGYIHDACLLARDGEALGLVTQVRKVMKPVWGGVGALNITTEDQELAQLARKLVRELKWSGPAQVEFKKDERDGSYRFIEFNTKFWGTLDLSIRAGVNFPVMMRDHLLEGRIEPGISRPGAAYYFMASQLTLARRQMKREGWRLKDFRTWPVTRRFRDFDWRDPLPDIHRRLAVWKKLLLGRTGAVNRNIPLEVILGHKPGEAG